MDFSSRKPPSHELHSQQRVRWLVQLCGGEQVICGVNASSLKLYLFAPWLPPRPCPLFIIVDTHSSRKEVLNLEKSDQSMSLDSVRNKWLDGTACTDHSPVSPQYGSDYSLVPVFLPDPCYRYVFYTTGAGG
jgi:hypothetical protein